MKNNQIEKLTFEKLLELNLLEAPINVEKLCTLLNVEIVRQNLEDEVSGFLVRKNNKDVIGLNQSQHEVRQRFTIAHELGHFILHKDQPLFVDYYRGSKLYRSSQRGQNYLIEKQANFFAASLLMPKKLVNSELKKLSDDLDYDIKVDKLSRKFKVSFQAMDYRLKYLGNYDYGF
ncbi:uncharacterized protein DUF955 [Tenacibaculum adriaticum]|uniref:Uncharacterized protein DUF955 n=1 Tax=Tenacibaculum adriaticum TaxID=413713 RepID=A0A5S5DWE2_9FLAO|nr:ImmA/IrrE family metallo-endopeptidase [Tenacibaculum adriaticum]TYQ00234.1 uncharacterized protein DUF955 [Tenacibaculum adriaticum]